MPRRQPPPPPQEHSPEPSPPPLEDDCELGDFVSVSSIVSGGSGAASTARRAVIRRLDSFRNGAREAVREVRAPDAPSQFEDWSDDDLREFLARNGAHLRGAAHASHETLVRICNDAFGDGEEKTYAPRSVTWEDLVRMERAARRIQWAYCSRKERARGGLYDDGRDHEGILMPDREDEDDYADDVDEVKNRRLTRHCNPSNTYSNRKLSMLQRIEANDLDDELEVEWRKPSWRFAKKYEAMNHPHRAGKDMARYNWRKVTLGRHCTLGGCGEQLDLCNEGRTSEFAQFGSGITNYFKFLKWCTWVMVILSFIHLPVLMINTYGATMQYGASSAALTTFGNLGSASEVLTVRIPGCRENQYRFNDCTIHKDTLAIFYALLDATGTVLVIVAWLWLQLFQKNEAINLNRSTVTASDYTLRVQNLPRDSTEAELAAHFSGVTEDAVAAVHIAYRNGKEIKQYFKRGKLMRKRFNRLQRLRFEKTKQNSCKETKKEQRRINNLLKERDELTSMIQMRDDERIKLVDSKPQVIQAFVTFETEEGLVKAVSAYQQNWFRVVCCCYPNHLLFKGMRLHVSQSPEPSTIVWENLEVPNKSIFLRKCLTTGTATLAIFLSIIFTFLARDFQNNTRESMSKACPSGFMDLSHEERYDVIQQDTNLAHCFCSNLDSSAQWEEDLCQNYVKNKAKSSAMSFGAGFMVVFMNAFFTYLMDKAGPFEKHHSLDRMEESNMARVFFLKFVNTGCLVLLYNQKWLQHLIGINFEKDAPDFNVDWYATGGVSLMITMVLNIFTPHVGTIIEFIGHRLKIRKLESRLTKVKETDDRYRIW